MTRQRPIRCDASAQCQVEDPGATRAYALGVLIQRSRCLTATLHIAALEQTAPACICHRRDWRGDSRRQRPDRRRSSGTRSCPFGSGRHWRGRQRFASGLKLPMSALSAPNSSLQARTCAADGILSAPLPSCSRKNAASVRSCEIEVSSSSLGVIVITQARWTGLAVLIILQSKRDTGLSGNDRFCLSWRVRTVAHGR